MAGNRRRDTDLFRELEAQRQVPEASLQQRDGGRDIENEGFNPQKNWQGDITHACSHDVAVMKNHYLMPQISDMVKQHYEWFYLKKMEI